MKVSFPNMGNSWLAFKTFFECMGAEVILPDPTNRNDVKIGVKHSPELVCFPFKTTLGDFVNAIEKDVDTLVMAIDCGDSGEAGLLTRVESFVEMVRRKKKKLSLDLAKQLDSLRAS